tara:strand:- start:1024 stop:1446 length:423 start_codon:yes stop_codon:yes gene_type:complete
MSNKQAEAQAGYAAIKAIYKKGFFEVGENKYEFSKMPFKKAKKIFAYLTAIAGELEAGQLGFIDSHKFDNDIEPLLFQYMLVNGFKLDTVDDHFDEFPSDYIEFVSTAIQGFAAPFLPEVATASASKAKESQSTTLKKQM